MTHTKDDTHLGNSQWRVDIRVDAFWKSSWGQIGPLKINYTQKLYIQCTKALA